MSDLDPAAKAAAEQANIDALAKAEAEAGAGAAADDDDAGGTKPADVAEGREAAALDLSAALALEAAQKAVGCPTPPAAQAAIDAADADQVAEIRKAIADRKITTHRAPAPRSPRRKS